MAEAFIQILLDNLNTLIQGEIGLIMSVDTEMKKLQSTLTAIQAVLEDAEEQQLTSNATRNWLCKLNDLTYEIDDILDEYSTKAAKMKYNNSKYYPSNLRKILYHRKIGKKMKEVMEKLNVVAEERLKFHLREIAFEKQSKVIAGRETSSVLNDSEHLYGREEEKETIVHMLINQVRECEQLSILPIVGIGALGKTTLAQLVFNDPRVAEHFGTKFWVCASDNFDLKTLIKAMIESLTRSSSDLETLDTLQRHLCELLNQKRYLLVLDDVWNEDQNRWFDLKNVLACGSSGASIILTTRIKKIADMMSTLPTQELTGLSTENCWLLFKQHAFGQEEEKYPSLEVIGKHIVIKCVGVPLAAKTLGGLLRFKRKEKDWLNVKESEIWNLPQEETSILPVMQLSYHHLPLNVRQCFAYCAVFPKDYVMEKEEVIRLWISHGYISSNQILEVEDVGDGIWNELVLRSFFQEVQTWNTKTRFKMHDLVHDLAQSILENKVPGAQAESNIVSTRRNKIRQVNLRSRSMAFPTNLLPDMDLSSVIKKFSHLRSLDGSFIRVENLPSALGKLNHLRYLNLSHTPIRTIPNTICSLWNLKILNLKGCYELVRLPKHMRRMCNLRHVYLEGCLSLSEMPPKIGEVTFLRTWCVFIVGHEKGSHLEELESLNNLGGTLTIKHLERVKSHIDAKKANLAGKQNLRKLTLEWGIEWPEKEYEKILEALEPHRNLESLEIRRFKGKQFPTWMENSTLENIVRLDIRRCPNCLHLPQVLADLPSLKRLELWGVGMEYIIENDVVNSVVLKPKFPSLETLHLIDNPNLKGLLMVESGYFFPVFEELHCSSLRLPHLPSVKELKFKRCRGMNLASISKLPNLKNLELTDYHGDFAKFLEEVKYSNSLTSLSLESFTKMMRIRGQFVELPEEIRYLCNITSLGIYGPIKLKRIPEALQFMTSLRELSLEWLPELNSLPDGLCKCTSLSSLYIYDCPKLELFPDSIKQLRNLETLEIRRCPELEKWCEKKKGEGDDWYKIVRIRNW